MSKNTKSPTPLSTMLGDGDSFIIRNGKSYTVNPMNLADVNEFMKANMSVGSQLYNVANEQEMKKIDRWLGGTKDKEGNIIKHGYCFDEEDTPVTLEKAMEDGWNLADLKNFIKRLCDISG